MATFIPPSQTPGVPGFNSLATGGGSSLTTPSVATGGSALSQIGTAASKAYGSYQSNYQASQTPASPYSGMSGNYTIASGDTLNNIAAKYGTTAAALAAENGIDNPNLIQAGASLRVPGQTAPATTGAVTSPTGTGSTNNYTMPPMSSSYANTLAPTSNFAVDTSGALPSSALGSANGTAGDNSPTNSSYASAVQNLYNATQLPQSYTDALSAYNAAKLKTQSDTIAGNYQGDTTDFAQGLTARQLQTDNLGQIASSNALTAAQAQYQSNVDANKSLVTAYSPTSVSPGSSLVNPVTGSETYSGLGGYQAVQGIQTVNNLANTYPDAGILPTDNLQTAQQKASSAPSFASRQLVQVTLPGGGIEFVNKNQLQTNADGSYTISTPGQAASANAAASTISQLTQQKAQAQAAVSAADSNFPLLMSAAQAAGVNNNAPLLNQIQQAVSNKLVNSTALASLNVLTASLQTEYARILSRGGQVDDNTRNSATALINGNYSLSQLQAVYNTVKQESGNVIAGYDSAIAQQQASLGGGSHSSSYSGSGSGGLYHF